MELRIGIISDIHIGPRASYKGMVRKIGDAAEPLTAAFVEAMNTGFEPHFVVNLGDVVQDSTRAVDKRHYGRAFEILSGLDAPQYPVVGNHDLITMSPEDLLEVWGGLSHLKTDGLYYTFEHGGVQCVVLHSHEKKDSHVWIDADQVAWLGEVLGAGSGPAVVFMHHTLADQDTSGNHWFRKHPRLALVQNRAEVREVIEGSGRVMAVINGHLHWNTLWASGGIPYITVQSLIENSLALDPPRACGAWAELRLRPGEGFELRVVGEDPAWWGWP